MTESPVDPDEPLTLDEACELLFRNHIRPATLRVERDRGNLVTERIGRREFVTRRAIQEMREKCRERRQPATSGSRPASSVTDHAGVADAALKANAKKLKSRSRK